MATPKAPPKPVAVTQPSANPAAPATVGTTTAEPELTREQQAVADFRKAKARFDAVSSGQADPQVEGGGDSPTTNASDFARLEKNWNTEAVLQQLLSGDHFEDNASNMFNNLAFHWRLFCMPDEDFLFMGGADGKPAVTNIKEFYAKLDSYKQIIIAESGVTGYNITEVEFGSVFGDSTSRGSQLQSISMKIVEPNGVSFLDSLARSTLEVGIRNYTDFFYYIELTFKGYEKNGEIELSPFEDLDNGGRWIWAVTIADIEVSLNTGGGQYRLQMIPLPQNALTEEYSVVIDTTIAQGNTVGEIFSDIATKLNADWEYRLMKKGVVSHSFKFHGLRGGKGVSTTIEGADTSAAPITATAVTKELTGEAVAKMNMTPEKADLASLKQHGFIDPEVPVSEEDKEAQKEIGKKFVDTPTAYLNKGMSIPAVVDMIFSTCEAAQFLAKDSYGEVFSPDQSADKMNDKGFRECVTWQVIPEVKFIGPDGKSMYDGLSNRYARQIVWHVYPRVSHDTILSRKQITDALDPKNQKEMVAGLAARGFLPKRYDYLFTGLNTEVLNCDLNFNFTWQVQLPQLLDHYHHQPLQNARYNEEYNSQRANTGNVITDAAQADAAFQREVEEFKEANQEFNSLDPDATAVDVLVAATASINASTDLFNASKQKLETRKKLALARQEADSQFVYKAPEQDYTREYIETLTRFSSAEDESNPVTGLLHFPATSVSNTSGGTPARLDAGEGGFGQYHAGRSLYGAVLNQVYGLVTNKFQEIDITIRGDPFWIGTGSFEQSILHNDDVLANRVVDTTQGMNCFMFRFKYPSEAPEGGTMVSDNEIVTGIYQVTQVKSKFNNGQFIQELHGVRLPLINLYASVYGIGSGDSTTEGSS